MLSTAHERAKAAPEGPRTSTARQVFDDNYLFPGKLAKRLILCYLKDLMGLKSRILKRHGMHT